MKRLSEVRRLGRSGPTRRPHLDARTLIVATGLFIGCVVTLGKYDLNGVLAFLALPLLAVLFLRLPMRPLIRKLLFVSPFVIGVGLFNPFLDPEPMALFGTWTVRAGLISFLVMSLKAVLSVLAVFLLAELLPFEAIGTGLRGLRVPDVFVTQLLFLHRYLFLLVEEAQTLKQARDLKSFGGRGTDWRTTARLLGSLFLRALDRSQRIHRCMVSRGFDGSIHMPSARPFGVRDLIFLVLAVGLCAGLRLGVH
jgi:cobalt/nickel transport system permease protein